MQHWSNLSIVRGCVSSHTYIDYQGHQESCISSISLTVQHNHINQTTTSWYPVLLFYFHLLRHLELLRRWLGLPWRASSCYSEIRFLGICWALSYTGFIGIFLIFIVSILLDHCYCTLHILIDVYCIVLVSPLKSHIFCHCKEMSSLNMDIFYRKKNEVDLHGWAFLASHLQISDRSLWRARIDFSRRTQDCDHHDPWHGRFKKEGHVTMSRLARVIASEVKYCYVLRRWFRDV